MKIRAKTFKNWMKANFSKDQLRDIARYGADTGWGGLTYYSDTSALYRRFADEIWEALAEDAEALGHANVAEFIASFSRSDMLTSRQGFEQLVVWYMAERTARNLVGDED